MKPWLNRRAFTLIELLVVIVIIGIIVALLFPALMSALDKARGAKCAANMSSIYRAYTMRTADEQKNFRWIPIRSAGWAGILLAYVDGKEKIFRCPVDRTGHWGGIDAMVTLGRIGRGMDPAYTMTQLESGRNYPMALQQYHSGGNYYTEVTVPGMADRYISVGWYRGAPSSTGSWVVCVSGGQAAQYTWNPFVAGNEGLVCTVFAGQKRIRPDADRIGVILFDAKGEPNKQTATTNLASLPGGTLINVGMVTHCSYGMNDCDIEGGVWTSGSDWMLETYPFFWPKVPASKVLIMDYTNAQVAAHTMASNTVTWGTNAVPFMRHTGRSMSNVMYGDGSVQLMVPATIDPGVAGNYARYWQPEQP